MTHRRYAACSGQAFLASSGGIRVLGREGRRSRDTQGRLGLMRHRLGLDSREKLGRKVRGQALNDVKEFQDFLLTQGINLVVQQFDFEFRLHIDSVVVFCVPAVNLGLTVLAHHDDGRCITGHAADMAESTQMTQSRHWLSN